MMSHATYEIIMGIGGMVLAISLWSIWRSRARAVQAETAGDAEATAFLDAVAASGAPNGRASWRRDVTEPITAIGEAVTATITALPAAPAPAALAPADTMADISALVRILPRRRIETVDDVRAWGERQRAEIRAWGRQGRADGRAWSKSMALPVPAQAQIPAPHAPPTALVPAIRREELAGPQARALPAAPSRPPARRPRQRAG